MTKGEMAQEIERLERLLEEERARKIAVPGRVKSALKDIARKGDRMSANLAEAALRDVV